jgi:enterochelin esterase family protein
MLNSFLPRFLLMCALLPVIPVMLSAAPPLLSPEIDKDGVTFRLDAPQAKEVQLLGQWSKWEARAMTRDDKGVWSIKETLPAGIWEYSFNVDGLKVLDSLNPSVKPERHPSTSFVHLAAEPPALWDEQEIPHGVLHTHRYFSKVLGRPREVVVYTPAGYDPLAKRLPVLYLAHGSGDNERTWTVLGKAHWIADALIASKRAKPMIIVMPDAHALPMSGMRFEQYGPVNTAAFVQELRGEVRPLVEKNYHVRRDAEGRAFAGLSMGGHHAFSIALYHADEFAWVAAFSPAPLSDDESKAALTAPDSVNSHLRYFAVSIGQNDFLLPRAEPFVNKLKAAGIKPEWHVTEGDDHSWPVWRRYLSDLLPRLF